MSLQPTTQSTSSPPVWTRIQTYFENRFDDPKMPYAILVIVIAILSSFTSLAVSKDPITRAYADARVQRIYGGTNEIMKEVITRSMGLGK